MIATTMYWPVDTYQKIGELAKSARQAKAEYVREAVEEKVTKDTRNEGNAAKFFAGLREIQFKGGPKDLAKNHDHYAWD